TSGGFVLRSTRTKSARTGADSLTAEREGTLRPDQERGPVPAGFGERIIKSVQLRRRHAQIYGASRMLENIPACRFEKRAKTVPEVVVGDRRARCPLIVDVVRGIGEGHSRGLAGE